METRANYVMLGAFTLFMAAMAMLFALWLARAQFNANYAVYDIVFQGPVRGLIKGGEVRFNGIKVGEITNLEIDELDAKRVVVRVRIDGKTPVRTSSDASLEALGLTGIMLIQLTAGDEKDPLLVRRMGQPVPRIYAKKGALDDLVAAGQDIAQRVNETLAQAQEMLSEENAKRVTAILNNLEIASAKLNAQNGTLAQVDSSAASLRAAADQFTKTAASIEKLSEETRVTMADLGPKATKTLDETQRAATALADTANGARDAVDTAAYQTLPDISTAARDLRRLSVALQDLANEAESGQLNLLPGGTPKPTVKVRP